jgi:DNA replication and repair protein RecF
MSFSQLKLTNFKNYRAQTFDLSPRLNCFVGMNGMGKTNVLDAIYYLSVCKSFFNLSDAFLTLHGEDFFRLEASPTSKGWSGGGLVAKVQSRKLKVFEYNGVPYEKLSDHIGRFPVVMIAPDDTLLATEGSEERRRYLDLTLSQVDRMYLEQVMLYNKVLQQRNAALKQFAQFGQYDKNLIDIYNRQLLAPAAYIHEKRSALMAQLQPIFQDYYRVISGDREQVLCTYESALNTMDFPTLLLNAQEKDRILQRTTTGIHKDDLLFSFDGTPVKRFASQGQLKSFVLAMKLTQYELLRQTTDRKPMLLLDDIFDKLDAKRVEHLVGLLLERDFGQIFITDTHESRIADIIKGFNMEYKLFVIEDGTIK